MDFMQVLAKMEEIENLASELYERYHASFIDDHEAAYFFYRLHIDERGHGSLIRYISRLADHNPELFESIDINEKEVDNIRECLRRELSRVEMTTLDEALNVAEKIEIDLFEGYLQRLPCRDNPILLNLYQALGEADHAGKVTAFKMKRMNKPEAE